MSVDCYVSSLLYDHVLHDTITLALYKWTIDSDCPTNKSQNHSIEVTGFVNGLICLIIERKELFFMKSINWEA
ncbi:hypothetical protein H5410_045245 [Solanum commersonii]|uniref:Uncharacterized protein n=1 Tax=Solanum commersonii TaxID=4109 RepID=A0A9J5X941_SOLCO|nr:hypothetical protein H5410_045245 [Solanum commersonii]